MRGGHPRHLQIPGRPRLGFSLVPSLGFSLVPSDQTLGIGCHSVGLRCPVAVGPSSLPLRNHPRGQGETRASLSLPQLPISSKPTRPSCLGESRRFPGARHSMVASVLLPSGCQAKKPRAPLRPPQLVPSPPGHAMRDHAAGPFLQSFTSGFYPPLHLLLPSLSLTSRDLGIPAALTAP